MFCSYPVLHFLAVISDKAHAPPRSSCGHSVPVAVQLLSRVLLSVTPWTAARQAPLSSSISQSLLRFTSVVSVTLSNHLILSYPLLVSLSLSQHQCLFQWVVLSNRWPKYWSFNISPFHEYSGFISFRNDWFDLLAVPRTLKSLLQHYSSEVLILLRSAFFMVQRSDPYVTTRKTIALTMWSFVCKVMSAFQHAVSVCQYSSSRL